MADTTHEDGGKIARMACSMLPVGAESDNARVSIRFICPNADN